MTNIEPIYDFFSDNKKVLINSSTVSLSIDETTYQGNGEAFLELIPRSQLLFHGHFEGVSAVDATRVQLGKTQGVIFTMNGIPIEGSRLSCGGDATTGKFDIKWSPHYEPIIGTGNNDTSIASTTFHLLNFVSFSGTRRSTEKEGNTCHPIEHLELKNHDWCVEIRSLKSTKKAMESLKEEGGYRLTHIGSFEKNDDITYSGEEAECFINTLKFFLSFAIGRWIDPVCAVGHDGNYNQVWESWSSPRDTGYTTFSWFDRRRGEQLSVFFPKFMDKWSDDDWKEALHEVIYWYLIANDSSRGIDAGIILTQAAIERLSYEFAVKSKKLVTAKGFKDLWASDKFRLLFSSLDIPIEIPNEMKELQTLAKKHNWIDAPHALTETRNSLVHPEHKKRGQLDNATFEAWNLGLWFLELGILAVCQYSGTYGNRLKQRGPSQAEVVPWKPL